MDMGIMTQEDKELLLIDLCSREPYHPKIQVFNDGYEGFQIGEFDTDLWLHHIDALRFDRIEIKPYLRPMSSMTEEEEKELKKIHHQFYKGNFIDAGVFSADDCGCTVFEMSNILNYLRSHHFDYYGMIDRGLALEAPEGMYN